MVMTQFWHVFFSLPEGFFLAAFTGVLIGAGSTSVYLFRRTYRTLERAERPIHRSISLSIRVGYIFLGTGLALFVVLLTADMLFTGKIFTLWVLAYILTSVVITGVLLVPIFVTKRREQTFQQRIKEPHT